MTSKNLIVLVCSGILLATGGAKAQSDDAKTPTDKVESLGGDETKIGDIVSTTTIPRSPVGVALGLAESSFVSPESPGKLVSSILNGLDANGNFKTGVAVDFAPFLMLRGHSLTIRDYRTNSFERSLTRINISAAVVKGTESTDKSARASVGLYWTAIDTGDNNTNKKLDSCALITLNSTRTAVKNLNTVQRDAETVPFKNEKDRLRIEIKIIKEKISIYQTMNKQDDIKILNVELNLKEERLKAVEHQIDIIDNKVYQAAIDEELKKSFGDFEKCWQKNTPRFGDSTSVKFGIAPIFDSPSGNTSDFTGDGFVATSTWSIGLNWLRNVEPDYIAASPADDEEQFAGRLLVGANYRHKENVVQEDVTPYKQNRLTVGLQLELGNPEKYLFNLEGAWEDANRSMLPDDSYIKYTAGASIRVTETIWANLSLGGTSGKNKKNELLVLSGLKWNFNRKSDVEASWKAKADKK